MRRQCLDSCSPPGQVPHTISTSPTCGAGSSGAIILRSGVGSSDSPLGGGRQDAPEWCSGASGPAGSRLLQLHIPGREGDGGWRPVSDLSAQNGFIMLTKFRMETVALVLSSICWGDWMRSVALKDAYFQIPIHPKSQLYLQFCLEGCVYQFWTLCFGLSTAP